MMCVQLSYFAGFSFGKKNVSGRQITVDKVPVMKEVDGACDLLAEVE